MELIYGMIESETIRFHWEPMMNEHLGAEAGALLESRGWRLAVAESCTGGLVGNLITDVPGSSNYFVGGIIAYSDEIKAEMLGVSMEALARHGAVSQEVALAMANGIRRAFEVDVAAAVTGIAGPSGGTPEKPVGTTWIAVTSDQWEHAKQFRWEGDRLENKRRFADAALQVLVERLKGDG